MDIVRLGFASVKGTAHLPRASVALDDHGPVGDRDFCLVDLERHQVLRTVHHRALLGVRVHWDGADLTVELPSGAEVSGPPDPTGEEVTCAYWERQEPFRLLGGPHSALLSEHLGKPVHLVAAPRGAAVYAAPVSLVSTASLHDLAERTGRDDLLATAARFRMTAVVDAGDEPYVEDRWFGNEIRIGDAVLSVDSPVARCAIIDLDPTTGEKDGSLLKALSEYRPDTGGAPWFGVDATVVTPGTLEVATALPG